MGVGKEREGTSAPSEARRQDLRKPAEACYGEIRNGTSQMTAAEVDATKLI